ncbi:MAG: hypothetical protein SF066_21165 [Thermoanaerobaculia bacterium]|nr:hypothetical protein [Thermoanaerobaculia bacterium]
MKLRWLAFGIGLVVSLWLVWRGQLGGDQLNLLARGWLLVNDGEWIAYGNPMSTGGHTPGGVTSLLIGLPLFLWLDPRAPSLLVFLFHLAGWFVLERGLRGLLSEHERLWLVACYWLSPWRLFFSGFLWNPNYLFFFGALHLWACRVQRDRPRFWPSFALAGGLVLALQIHPSALLLLAACGLLWLRRYFQPHWLGGIAGALVAGSTLIPWFLTLASQPTIVTEVERGFPFRGLVLVYPLLRGLSYWFRYPTPFLPEKVTRFDFSTALGGEDVWLGPLVTKLAQWLLPLTLVVALGATVWLLRRWHRRRWWAPLPATASGRRWLHGYLVWCWIAGVGVYALAPTTPRYWQGVCLFHAAVLTLVMWIGVFGRSRLRRRIPVAVFAWTLLGLGLAVAVGLGSPQYRCGGRGDLRFPLASHSPMFDELGIQRSCPWPLDQPGTWWPDVLPRGEPVAISPKVAGVP